MKNSYLLSLIFLFCGSFLWGQLWQATAAGQESFKEAKKEFKLSNYEAAATHFTIAISMKCNNMMSAYFYRGFSYQQLGKHMKAIQDYEKVISIDNNFYIAYCFRATSNVALENFEEAILDYDKSLTLNISNPRAYALFAKKKNLNMIRAEMYRLRGLAKEKLGRLKEAKKDYEKAISINPKDKEAKDFLTEIKKQLSTQTSSNNKVVSEDDLELQKTNKTLSKPKIWSVAVGIDQYQYDSHLTDLETPKDNAYEFVREVEGLDFVDHRIPVLTNRRASKKAILDQLKSTFLSPKVGADDMIIFYFSGHGMTMGDRIGICPYNYFNPAELITDEDIKAILNKSPARHKICIIEACKTKVNTMASLPLAAKQRFNTQRKNISGGIVYITSTKAGEESYEYPNMGAVFSHYFLRGIKGEADSNSNKTITIKELFDFLKTNVARATNNKQVPQINQEGYRDIPFIVIN